MIYLHASTTQEIFIEPRWPYSQVAVSEGAYAALLQAQRQLSLQSLQLVLTRGYEYEPVFMKFLHKTFRYFCAALFCIIYLHRFRECPEIFSANGHDRNGDSIDIGIISDGKRIALLPHGILTTHTSLRRTHEKYEIVLNRVTQALQATGFILHANATEALQIHCHLSDD